MKYKITEWINEDELTEEKMYDILYPLSIVNIVRLFPKKFEPLDCPASESDGGECECEMTPRQHEIYDEIEKDELKDIDLKKFGLVTIDDVLKVFDDAYNRLTYPEVKEWSMRSRISYIRRAIEQMKRMDK